MHERALRRAAALTAAALLLTASVAVADTLPGDTDDLSPGIQGTVALGPVATGGRVSASLWFQLTCKGLAHVDPGQSVQVAMSGAQVPTGGVATSTGTVIGPAPADWPADGQGCPTGAVVRSTTPATVTLTAPPTPGVFDYTVDFSRTLSPAGAGDASALTSLSGATFRLTVVADTPPSLALPPDLVVEGDTTGGATVAYVVGATDPDDVPPPTPACAPATGSFFALGETAVACTVEDSAGHRVAGTFTVRVVDTTPPAFVSLPTPIAARTADPTGALATYALPTASDIVDPAPTVSCSPPPGAPVGTGTTTVTCTAADASGNRATASFPLTVAYDAPASVTARFAPPIGRRDVVVARAGRTIPVKVRLLRDGAAVRSGAVDLVLARCDGGATIGSPRALRWRNHRWTLQLRTTGLAGCVRATLRLDGVAVDSFELHLRPLPDRAHGRR